MLAALRYAVNNHLFENAYGESCTPPPGESNSFWRVSKAGCVTVHENSTYNPDDPPSLHNYYGSLGGCDINVGCCLTYFQVEWHHGELMYTELHSEPMGSECDPEDPDCITICD
ncbi:MAG: hypothetical protein ACOCWM_02700 [Cyclobacteriaceae bacterium]